MPIPLFWLQSKQLRRLRPSLTACIGKSHGNFARLSHRPQTPPASVRRPRADAANKRGDRFDDRRAPARQQRERGDGVVMTSMRK